jgi:hypothetical protein
MAMAVVVVCRFAQRCRHCRRRARDAATLPALLRVLRARFVAGRSVTSRPRRVCVHHIPATAAATARTPPSLLYVRHVYRISLSLLLLSLLFSFLCECMCITHLQPWLPPPGRRPHCGMCGTCIASHCYCHCCCYLFSFLCECVCVTRMRDITSHTHFLVSLYTINSAQIMCVRTHSVAPPPRCVICYE